MSIIAVEAKPLSRSQIRTYAHSLRELLGLSNQTYIDVLGLVEFVLPTVLEGYYYDVLTMSEMGDKHGEADPSALKLTLREDVYQGLVEGKGRDRFTAMHEIAHLLLHTPDRIVLNRRGGVPPAYKDPEWQANCLAGEFLGSHLIAAKCQNPRHFAETVGISFQAAQFQWHTYSKEGLLLPKK